MILQKYCWKLNRGFRPKHNIVQIQRSKYKTSCLPAVLRLRKGIENAGSGGLLLAHRAFLAIMILLCFHSCWFTLVRIPFFPALCHSFAEFFNQILLGGGGVYCPHISRTIEIVSPTALRPLPPHSKVSLVRKIVMKKLVTLRPWQSETTRSSCRLLAISISRN